MPGGLIRRTVLPPNDDIRDKNREDSLLSAHLARLRVLESRFHGPFFDFWAEIAPLKTGNARRDNRERNSGNREEYPSHPLFFARRRARQKRCLLLPPREGYAVAKEAIEPQTRGLLASHDGAGQGGAQEGKVQGEADMPAVHIRPTVVPSTGHRNMLLNLTRACPQLEDSQADYRVIHRQSADSELTDAPLRPSG